ncbi:helix-turn-helix domain-containing protein [Streptomyces sp. SID14478]|uniref:helix-turn-helix domain-containing protein n=1 Tax=Streptomyces sp. SID14478 TaxID=2706073 RepID=UPI0013DB723C|nr:helix-turn-helix transcriptional regulator [Streptomyces sp. SID14478]NEB78616.1 helix-turn-helix domain-containing protein [Streptomyces sp. SID14478]
MSTGKRPPRNPSAMRMVGQLVALFRKSAGFTQAALGKRLVVAEATIAAIEQGRRPLLPDLADAMDQLLDTKGALAVAVANMPEIDQFPLWAESYIKHEREAIALSKYDAVVMPGLLQSEDMARAVLRERVPAYDPDEIEAKTAARIERQTILHRKVPPTVSFVIWEPVLHLSVGDPQVRHRQLRYVREQCELPGLTVQILPQSSRHHAALDGPFTLLETPDHQHLAYTETQRGSQWVADRDEVSILERKYAMLRSQALSPQDSMGLLERLLGER